MRLHNLRFPDSVSIKIFSALIIFGVFFPFFQKHSAQYRFDSWTTDNGLPQVSINSIAQTGEGFLWLTTFGGIVRYNGLKFQVFNTGNTDGLETSRFASLYEDRAGNLWISTENRGIVRYKDYQFKTFSDIEFPNGSIKNQTLYDAEGNLLFKTQSETMRWTGEKFLPHRGKTPVPLGDILFRTREGAVWYFDGARLRRLAAGGTVSVDMSTPFVPRRVFEDSKKRLWIAAEGRTDLILFENGEFKYFSKSAGYPEFRFFNAAEDRAGNVFFATAGGLVRFKNGKFDVYTTAEGLAHDWTTDVFIDRENTVWVGTIGGLSRLTERTIEAFSTADGLAADNVYPIFEDRRKRIWIGSWKGLSVYENGVFRDAGKEFGVSENNVTAIFEDRNENLWIGSWNGSLVRTKNGQTKTYAAAEITGAGIRAIFQDRSGNLWIGTSDGLARFKDEKFEIFPTQKVFEGKEFYRIFEDRAGRIWFGTDAGLALLESGKLSNFSAENGFSAKLVRAIYEDAGGTLWIGTYDSGLFRYRDGKFTRYTSREGLFDNGVFEIIEDELENFWISSNFGIYRVKKSDLNDFAEGRAVEIISIPYNKRDGMLNSECNGGIQPAGIKASDGRIWFPTQKGVAVIDPDKVPFNSEPPPVVIESVSVDTRPIDPGSPVELAPGQTNLEIHYAGLSFINPELVKFRYKLEGLDKDWINAGTRRTAYYSHLPPGVYRFKVLAANRDNVWNLTGADLEIRVLPAFWQTAWFWISAAMLLFAATYAVYRWRIGLLQKTNDLQKTFARRLIESQEDERRRIAVELHDSIGQSLILIKNWALLGMKSNGRKDSAKENLLEISEMASASIDEVREIAYNLGPFQIERLGLKKSVEEMIEKISLSSEIRFETEIGEIDGLFSRQTEINLFRIVQEALNNIVKHSGASRAEVSFKPIEASIALRIRDNGQGFSQDETVSTAAGEAAMNAGKIKKTGFGLLGMRERVGLLKGDISIRSDRGTEIFINVPFEFYEE